MLENLLGIVLHSSRAFEPDGDEHRAVWSLENIVPDGVS
jgi:hypothetical protein